MTGFKPHNEHFTYNNTTQLQERDPLLNKFLIDTVAYSVGGAVTGLAVGVLLRNPRAWSWFFAGFGAQHAYSSSPIKLKVLQ